ncbi:hypothetical protein A2U01_0076617, partial [Trifolium medium]|nr:hypothetical protein [Trifolium medium]
GYLNSKGLGSCNTYIAEFWGVWVGFHRVEINIDPIVVVNVTRHYGDSSGGKIC